MNAKPRKRLVHKQHYIKMVGKKSALYSTATALASLGTVLFFAACLLSWASFHGWTDDFSELCRGVTNGILAIGSIAGIWTAIVLFNKARKIEPGIPITRYNVQQIPAAESLVRAADAPPLPHATELLRAVSRGQETSPAELLRPATKDRPLPSEPPLPAPLENRPHG